MIKCGKVLSRLPNVLPNLYIFHCECGCGRSWQLRQRTRWLTYAFWIRSVPARDGMRVWVRIPKTDALLALNDLERG